MLYRNPALTVVFCCFCLPQIRKPELQKKEQPRRVLNPAEVMHNRIKEMHRKALEQAEKQAVQEQEVVSSKAMVKLLVTCQLSHQVQPVWVCIWFPHRAVLMIFTKVIQLFSPGEGMKVVS